MRNTSKVKFLLISAVGGWALFSAAQSYADDARAPAAEARPAVRADLPALAPEFGAGQPLRVPQADALAAGLLRVALASH